MAAEPIDVLDKTPNASVVKLPWRQFPGLVMQGDTLRIVYDDLVELKQLLEKTNDPTAPEFAQDVITALVDRFHGLLGHYEAILDEKGLQLPYSGRAFVTAKRLPNSEERRTPPWVEYPQYPLGSVFWKMGGGEDYLDGWLDWFLNLPKDHQDALQNSEATPAGWRDLLEHIRALK
jgi:hypothetical protein